jgi:hypothetical protein
VRDVDRRVFQRAQDAVDDLSELCLPDQRGGALYYRVTVPPGARLLARARGGSRGWRGEVAIRVLEGCAASECLAEALSTVGLYDGWPSEMEAASALWRNEGATERTVIVAFSGASEEPSELDLDVRVETAP